MIEWEEERVIHQNIDVVWSLFSDENIQKIMPQIYRHELLEKTEKEVGAKHRQVCKKGKRRETYIVETLDFDEKLDKKHKQIFFVIRKAIEIDLCFTLLKIDENHTKFIFSGCKQDRNFIGKAWMRIANHKCNSLRIEEFMDRVERQAMDG